MNPSLQPEDSLSQVVFIHDYLQLVFQSSCYSIYNSVTLYIGGTPLHQSQSGFCDALVSLIGEHATYVGQLNEGPLTIKFSSGKELRVSTEGHGPEAWQYTSLGQPAVVAQNA